MVHAHLLERTEHHPLCCCEEASGYISSDYDISKGTIRIPYDQPLPVELIGKIAKWCFEKYSK